MSYKFNFESNIPSLSVAQFARSNQPARSVFLSMLRSASPQLPLAGRVDGTLQPPMRRTATPCISKMGGGGLLSKVVLGVAAAAIIGRILKPQRVARPIQALTGKFHKDFIMHARSLGGTNFKAAVKQIFARERTIAEIPCNVLSEIRHIDSLAQAGTPGELIRTNTAVLIEKMRTGLYIYADDLVRSREELGTLEAFFLRNPGNALSRSEAIDGATHYHQIRLLMENERVNAAKKLLTLKPRVLSDLLK